MALEGLGVASNVAGLVSLGISVCRGILDYYASWKDAEVDLKRMYSSVEALTKTFIVLRHLIEQNGFSSDSVTRVEESIAKCEGGIANLQKKLSKIKISTQASQQRSHRLKVQFQRALYPFRESTLVKLKEICNGLRDDLLFAMETLQM